MEIIPPNLRIYQQILKDLENAFPFLNVPKAKAGRKPKLTDTPYLPSYPPYLLCPRPVYIGYVHYGSIYYKFYLLTIQKPSSLAMSISLFVLGSKSL